MSVSRPPLTLLALVDVALIDAGYLTALQVRFNASVPAFNQAAFEAAIGWITLGTLLCLVGLGFYGPRVQRQTDLGRAALVGALLGGLFAAGAAFWSRGFAFPRSVVILGTLFGWAFLLTWRLLLLRLRSRRPKRVLLVGAAEETTRLIQLVDRAPELRWSIINIIEPAQWQHAEETFPLCDAVLLGHSLTEDLRVRLAVAAALADKELMLVPDYYDLLMHEARVIHAGDLPLFQLPDGSLTPEQRFLKRLLDLIGAVMLFVVALPLMCACLALVALSDGWPALYTQERVGENGRLFRVHKFRTMVKDAEQLTGPVLAGAADPRITPVGRWLRRLRLDELPQLLDVIVGNMSLVGPRPERPHFVDIFGKELAHYSKRHGVKPGLTGWAQVMGGYATAVEDKLRMDLMYIYNYSPWRDLQILMQTAVTVLSREASEGLRQISASGPSRGNRS